MKNLFYIIKIKIICIFWAYKLGLKYKELNGIFLALNVMLKRAGQQQIIKMNKLN